MTAPVFSRTTPTERAIDSDRQFFARRPDRFHRIRRSSPAEVEENTGSPSETLSKGWCWYAVIRRLCLDVRLRVFVADRDVAEVDFAEAFCSEVFDRCASADMRELETRLRREMCREGEPE